MVLKISRSAGFLIMLFVSGLLVVAGCDKGPAYTYQSVSVMHVSDVNVSPSEVSHEKGSAPASTEGSATSAVANPDAPAIASSESSLPVVTVNELLQNDKPFDTKKIKVTGNLGQIMSLTSMSFIINKSDDHYIEFSYGQMSDSDKVTLTTQLGSMSAIAVVGVWDSSRKVLVGESLAM